MYGRKTKTRGKRKTPYGLRARSATARARVISRSFDLGADLQVRGLPENKTITPLKLDLELVEYEVRRAGWPVNPEEGVAIIVDPGVEKESPTDAVQDAQQVEEGAPNDTNGSAPEATPVAEVTQPEVKRQAAPAMPEPALPAEPVAEESKEAKGNGPIPDDVLMSDIQSILSTHKDQNATTDQARSASRVSSRAQPEPAPRGQQTPDGHAIFEAIAESMEQARAYDLGSVKLRQRFADFDRESDQVEAQRSARSRQQSRTGPAGIRANPTVEAASTAEFIKDLDAMKRQAAVAMEEEEIPLDPGIGGRSIAVEALMPGDIILSTTDQILSKQIRAATGSQVSHAALYIGDGKVIEAIDDGVILRSLDTALEEDSLAVAYRHRDMTDEKAERLISFATDKAREKAPFDYWGLLRAAPGQLARAICNELDQPSRQRCLDTAAQLRVGTDDNDAFYCSELVLKAFEEVGLSLSHIEPSWSSPGQVLDLQLTGLLDYVGHLKVEL